MLKPAGTAAVRGSEMPGCLLAAAAQRRPMHPPPPQSAAWPSSNDSLAPPPPPQGAPLSPTCCCARGPWAQPRTRGRCCGRRGFPRSRPPAKRVGVACRPAEGRRHARGMRSRQRSTWWLRGLQCSRVRLQCSRMCMQCSRMRARGAGAAEICTCRPHAAVRACCQLRTPHPAALRRADKAAPPRPSPQRHPRCGRRALAPSK